MKLERSKNSVRNMKMGFIAKTVSMILPFFVRTAFIYTLGSDYLGVNSLFSSVLSVLSLTELGFGSAVAFNMYKAIANEDRETINALLWFYRRVYRYIGLIILGIGLALIPVLPYLTKGSYPADINPRVVYLLFLFNTVISYFLFSYLNTLIHAFQRSDLKEKINLFMNIGMNALQILLLLVVKNYYVYLSIIPVFTVLNNLQTAVIAKRYFPEYRPFGKLRASVVADIKEKVSGLMIQKLCAVSRNAFDSIFISMFLGLTQIAVYNNYYYIMSTISGFMAVLTSATIAGAGNSIATETQEKNHQDMMKMNFVYMWLSGWCACCLLCLYKHFMLIWVGPELMLQMSSVILICAYFYVLRMGDIRAVYNDASGLWWQNRFRALMEAIANITLNYFLGKWIGINGIISATLISLFVFNFCYGSQIVYKHYFTKMKARYYYCFHGVCFLVTAIVSAATYLLCGLLPETIPGFLAKLIICAVVPNALYFVVYRKTKMYREAIPWIAKRVGIQDFFMIRAIMG